VVGRGSGCAGRGEGQDDSQEPQVLSAGEFQGGAEGMDIGTPVSAGVCAGVRVVRFMLAGTQILGGCQS